MMPKIFSTQKAIWSILKWSVESQIFLQIIKFELAKGKKKERKTKKKKSERFKLKKKKKSKKRDVNNKNWDL